MKWCYENLREGDFSLSDLTLVCQHQKEIAEVKCHAVILTSACKYFQGMLLGDFINEEKKKQ